MKKELLTVFLLSLPVCFASAGTLGVYTSPSEGFDTHTFYYDDGQEVVLFDTQFVPQLTQAMLDKIEAETTSKVTRVVVTHPNPDKFNGLALLHDRGITSISSKQVQLMMPEVHQYKKNFWVNVMGAFKASDYPAFENVQQTFNGHHTITMKSGETISLFELNHAGVAKTQVVARIDQTGDLIVGDLVHHRAHAWLEGGLENNAPAPDLSTWVLALSELPALSQTYPEAKVYGGRGEFALVGEAVTTQMTYLNRASGIVRDYLAVNKLDSQTLNQPEKATKHYQQLAETFSTEFPDYQAPYMIQYSVYGLVNKQLADSPSTAIF